MTKPSTSLLDYICLDKNYLRISAEIWEEILSFLIIFMNWQHLLFMFYCI